MSVSNMTNNSLILAVMRKEEEYDCNDLNSRSYENT